MLPRKRILLKISLSGAISWLTSVKAASLEHKMHPAPTVFKAPMVVKILHPTGQIVRDKRWSFLKAALDRTTLEYGPYVVEAITSVMSTEREVKEAIAGKIINIIAVDCGHSDLNENSIPVPIPIDRGLLGYRVALIRREKQDLINSVINIGGLTKLTVGQGRDWGDVPIYKLNKIPVVTNSDYTGLFSMLSNNRFDLFPRGVVEVIPEFNQFRTLYPDIVIDSHLLIKYDYAEFFYVSRATPLLAQRIADGLEIMLEDGSFERLFQARFSYALSDLHLARRTPILLRSPPLPPWIPVNRADLWHNPITEQD